MYNSARKSEDITPLIRDLHQLPVPQRIEFKLTVVCGISHQSQPYLARALRCVTDINILDGDFVMSQRWSRTFHQRVDGKLAVARA